MSPKTNDFTDLDIWQESKGISVAMYELTQKFPDEERYGLTSQLRRASISIPANIAEACGRYHFNDRVNFLYHARGSLEEVRSHIRIAKEVEFINTEQFKEIDSKLVQLRRGLNGLIKSWKNQVANN